MVAPDAGHGKLIQDIVGLMEGHKTHAKQGKAAKKIEIMRGAEIKTACCCK